MILAFNFCHAQKDSLQTVVSDSSSKKFSLFNDQKHSPLKATIYSAIIPGLGQAYNRKYWKIPIVYAGFAGLSYSVYYTHYNYQGYKAAYKLYLDGDSTTNGSFKGVTSASQQKTLRDYYRKYLDLSAIGMFVWYGLNLIDAAVDAHLYYFDVSDDLSIEWRPDFNFYYSYNDQAYKPSINLTVKLHL